MYRAVYVHKEHIAFEWTLIFTKNAFGILRKLTKDYTLLFFFMFVKTQSNVLYNITQIESQWGALWCLLAVETCIPLWNFICFREVQFDGVTLNTDDFFMSNNGLYNYDYARIGEAHQWNQKRGMLDTVHTPVINYHKCLKPLIITFV